MRIGIIGAGNIGSALAQRWVAAGHDVAIANRRGPESLAAVVATTGARARRLWSMSVTASMHWRCRFLSRRYRTYRPRCSRKRR